MENGLTNAATDSEGENNTDGESLAESEALITVVIPLEVDSDDKTSSKAWWNWKNVLSPQFLIYISHFFSSWGDRMWMFAGGLFLIEVTPGSLRLIAVYESALSLTVIIFGSMVGRWVDRTSRLKTAQLSLLVQNVMVCLCTALLCFLISYRDFFSQSLHGWAEILAEIGVIILACIAQIGTLGSKLTIEKDWIVVISGKDDTKLSKMNSVLRTVDLSTEMMAPVLVGFVMTYSGMIVGGIVIAVWNVVSFIIEYGILRYLFTTIPSLSKKKVLEVEQEDQDTGSKMTKLKERLADAVQIWGIYFTHNIRDAGLGLALLYMTVISLNNYSRAYVFEAGVSQLVLGVMTAVSSATGIAGSVTFPILRKKIGVYQTGILGFGSETACLVLCVVAVFAPGTLFAPMVDFIPPTELPGPELAYNATEIFTNFTLADSRDSLSSSDLNGVPDEYTSVALLITGMVSSRFGLWLADLTVTQVLIEDVREEQRGGINGVQYSLNQSFGILPSILLILLPTMATFGYLIILSFLFVASGLILFCVYSYRQMNSNSPAPVEGDAASKTV